MASNESENRTTAESHQTERINDANADAVIRDEDDSCICSKIFPNKEPSYEQQVDILAQYKCNSSDSGIEIYTTTTPVVTPNEKAPINNCNSNDFIGNTREMRESNQNINISCDSSMISNSSDLSELKENSSKHTLNQTQATNYSCSENGSESSSLANGSTISKKNSSSKKKFDLLESSTCSNKTTGRTGGDCLKNKNSTKPFASRSPSQSLQNSNRARSREKFNRDTLTICSKTNTTPFSNRSTPIRIKQQKPNFLPSSLDTTPTLSHRSINGIASSSSSSLTRARTPGTPSDDGRWPSVGGRGTTNFSVPFKRGTSVTPDLNTLKQQQRGNVIADGSGKCDQSLISTNPYGTLPRRRKQKSHEDLNKHNSRSISKENRLIASVLMPSSQKIHSISSTLPLREVFPTKCSRSKLIPKTTIYHETYSQTALTNQDMENMFANDSFTSTHLLPPPVVIGIIERIEKDTQSEMKNSEIQQMEEEIRQLITREAQLNYELNEKADKITNLEIKLTKERDEKNALQKEIHQNAERVMGILDRARLGTPTKENNLSSDSLLMLESSMQISGHELNEKQEEICRLRKFCRTLQVEVKRCVIAQENLMQEKASLEKESMELQDFLQHEKHAMYDALKDIEHECESMKRINNDKDEEIKVLRDECRHLVRLNEQRRQENKLMQTKYCALERKSKELIAQQNTAVSGASMALSGLHNRLHNLVEQLVSSYNISEQELEDIVFHHNDQYLNNGGNSSNFEGTSENEKHLVKSSATEKGKNNDDGSLSPQRNQSFLAAVINAIRNATTQSGKKLRSRSKNHPLHDDVTNGDESDSTEMLDSETEPCLMMDNVLEDVAINDSHSQNLVSSTGIISQMDIVAEFDNAVAGGDDSLHNLSQAIKNRQQIEMQIQKYSAQYYDHESSVSEDLSYVGSAAEMPSLIDYCPAQAVVDQVIDVDNLITKLLKVLRLIQMDNDNCIQQLILDKNKLQQNKEDMLEKCKDLQEINIKLQDELMDATQELMLKGNDLPSTKAEMQHHRNEIDRLLLLSSAFSRNQTMMTLPTTATTATTNINMVNTNNGILSLLKIWHNQGYLKEDSIIDFMDFICREAQKFPMNIKEKRRSDQETQNEKIHRVLIILNSIKMIVDDTPKLQKFQLEINNSFCTFHGIILSMISALSAANNSSNMCEGRERKSLINSIDMNANSPKRISLDDSSSIQKN